MKHYLITLLGSLLKRTEQYQSSKSHYENIKNILKRLNASPFQVDSIIIDLQDNEKVVSIYLTGVVGMEDELTDLIDYYSRLEDTKIDLVFNQIYGCLN